MQFRHVENALIRLFEVNDERMGAFQARMRHLRGLGVPSIRKTGSGARAGYKLIHAVELAVALELERLGISPREAASLALNYAKEIAGHGDDSAPRFLVVMPGHKDSFEIAMLTDGKDVASFLKSGASLSVINVSRLVHELDRHLSKAA